MASIKLASALASFGLLLSTPALAQSTGCGKQSTLTNGVHTINGREYILQIPNGYDSNTQHSLVFGFHWRGGNMNDVARGTGIEPWYGLEKRAEGTAIFVSPNGRNAGWGNSGGEDVRFVDSIIEAIEADLCIDQGKRFATGFSFGGGMSYALACARATKFRAVSVLAGGLISGCDGGRDPIAYLGIHGINDGVLGINGGINLLDRFVGNNGCQQSEIRRPATNSRGFVRTDFQGCSQPVSFIAYDGGHDGAPLGVGNPLAPDATWEFFTAAAGGNSGGKEPPTSEVPAAETPVVEAPTPTPTPTVPATAPPAATTVNSAPVSETPVVQPPIDTEEPSTEVPCDGGEDEEIGEEEAPCDGGEDEEEQSGQDDEEVAPCETEEEPEEEEETGQGEQPC